MAIKIPSKNVFSPIEHSLIKKNKIDKVNVSATIVKTEYEKDTVLFSKDVWDTNNTSIVYLETDFQNHTTTKKIDGILSTNNYYGELSNTLFLRYWYANIVIELPKDQYEGTIRETDSVDYTLQYKRYNYKADAQVDDNNNKYPKLVPVLDETNSDILGYNQIDYDVFSIYGTYSGNTFRYPKDIEKIDKVYEKDGEEPKEDEEDTRSDKVYSGKLYEEEDAKGEKHESHETKFTVPVWVDREFKTSGGTGHSVAHPLKSGTNTVTTKFTLNSSETEMTGFAVESELDFTAVLGNDNYNLYAKPTYSFNLASNKKISYDSSKEIYIVELSNVPVAYDWCVVSHIINGQGVYYEGNKGSSYETPIGRLCCKDEENGTQIDRDLTSYGEAIEPISLIVDVKGDKYSIDLQTTNISIGTGSNVTSVENNELLQRLNYTTDTNSGLTENLIRSGYQRVINKYKNGKETLKLKLAVGEYYDTDGNLAISTKDGNLKMLFEIGDEVVPYKNSALGKDLPMSVDKNGKAKSFIVVGTRIIYGGVLYQEITLQEKVS